MHELSCWHLLQHKRQQEFELVFAVSYRQVFGGRSVGVHKLLGRHVLRDDMRDCLHVGMHELSGRHVRRGNRHDVVLVVWGWDVLGHDRAVGVHGMCCRNVPRVDE